MTKNINNEKKLCFVIYNDFDLKFVNSNENKIDFFNNMKKISICTFVVCNFNDFNLFNTC